MQARRKMSTPASPKPISEKQAAKKMGEMMHHKVVKTGKLPHKKP